MSHRDDILAYLADERPHTTVEISESLGLCTSTAWKLLASEARYGRIEAGPKQRLLNGQMARTWRLVR